MKTPLTVNERYALWLFVKRAIDAEAIPQDIDANAIGAACLKLEPLNTIDFPTAPADKPEFETL